MKVYTVVCFVNTGWGTRIDNHDVFAGVEVFTEFQQACKFAEEWSKSSRTHITEGGKKYWYGSSKRAVVERHSEVV